MGNKFVALASVAVGVLYVAGYVVTDSSSTAMASSPNSTSAHGQATSQNAVAATAPATSGGAGNSASSGNENSNSTKTSKPSTPPAPPKKWLDGTYQGSGSNRIGSVAVAVTIKGGKITNVQITQCDTHYPESNIDPVMPQAVLQEQKADVGYVSSATLSSYDFMDAVTQSLQQAQNPKYTGNG